MITISMEDSTNIFYLPWARDEVLRRGLIGHTVKILFFPCKDPLFSPDQRSNKVDTHSNK